MDRPIITTPRRRRLERQLRSTADARVYRRTLAVVEVARGRPIAQVARSLGVNAGIRRHGPSPGKGHGPSHCTHVPGPRRG